MSFLLNSGTHLTNITFEMILLELLNSAAGKFMNEFVKQDELFRFGIPYTKKLSDVKSELALDPETVIIEFETYHGIVYFYYHFS